MAHLELAVFLPPLSPLFTDSEGTRSCLWRADGRRLASSPQAPRLWACPLPCLRLPSLRILIQFHLLCSLFSSSFRFPFAWVLLRVVLRGLTSLGSQQPSEKLRKLILPGCVSFLVSPATQVSPACYAREDWAWAPDLHEVMSTGGTRSVLEHLTGTVRQASQPS